MNLKYKFNPKMQLAYGIFGFLSAIIIIYIFTHTINWGVGLGVGTGNFIISGLCDFQECG
ncbi:MAG: hypothetical protein O8C66_07495 [Candidatus Methanoperedens sp.]|nr:hypothetical protein [Candidatus Methanoperedens sp.]MCZ7370338.1 hypothetical protein [Candidatus Methanoperedens sp.]